MRRVVFFVLLVMPAWSQAMDWRSLAERSRLTVGFGQRQLQFDYTRDAASDASPVGVMTTEISSRLFWALGSPYIYLSDKGGVYWEGSVSSFTLDRQQVNDRVVDLGTKVRGLYAYLAPVLFSIAYGPRPTGRRELSILVGLGVGVGYFRARGEMLLTEDGSDERLSVDKSGVGLSISILLFDLRYGPWSLRASGGGPFLEAGRGSYGVSEFALDWGYTFQVR